MKILCHGIASLSSFFGSPKTESGGSLPVVHYFEHPFTASFLYPNELFPAANLFVLCVLCMGACPQILFSVVECISVLMVAFFALLAAHYKAVHGYSFTAFFPVRVKTVRAFCPVSDPVPAIHSLIIFRIYERILAFCKWDDAVRWVLRLFNKVALLTVACFGHTSSEKGCVLTAAL